MTPLESQELTRPAPLTPSTTFLLWRPSTVTELGSPQVSIINASIPQKSQHRDTGVNDPLLSWPGVWAAGWEQAVKSGDQVNGEKSLVVGG